jgi:3-isopropylmalate/(R)-2-methylmalate dehydratase large subunit
VYGKDAALAPVNLLGCDKSAAYKAVEVVGSGVQALSVDDRLTICNMIAETGAKSGVVAADAKTREYLQSRTKSAYETAESDPDAQYEADWRIRLDQLEPLAAEPPLTENTRPARELSGVKIDHILLGSCTNGRLSDLRVAARMLKGKKIADSVRMIVVPASQRIMREAVREGLVEIFLEAGALVESASCAACIGRHTGVLASGETAVSTTNRNFVGRMGSRDSFVYLVSPATAAASDCRSKQYLHLFTSP